MSEEEKDIKLTNEEYEKKLENAIDYLNNCCDKLQQENTNLKKALNEIREYCNYNNEELYTCESDYDYEEELELNYYTSSFRKDILQIIDKVLGGSDENKN